jgi:large subunit ribosomal protein L19
MQKKVLDFNLTQRKEKFEFKAGDVVKIYKKIKEGEKERIQIFEGMIIAIKGRQSSSQMITVRKVTFGIGVEIIVPILSPNIEKIEIVKRAKVRQAKLYYVRERVAKALRFKFTDYKKPEVVFVEEKVEVEPKEIIEEAKSTEEVKK